MVYPNDSISEPFQMDMTLDKKQATSGAMISYEMTLWLDQADPMIYPNDSISELFQMDMTLDKIQATSGAIISYERALWLEQGTGYVVAIMMMMHA